MIKKILFATFLMGTSFTSVVKAQSSDESNLKAKQKYEKVDKELNIMYRKAYESLEYAQKPLLKEAQIQWIKFRESHCKVVESIYDGGSLQPTFIYECKTEISQHRIAELKSLLEG